MRTGSPVFPEMEGKPCAVMSKGACFADGVKDFGEVKADIQGFYVSDEDWTLSWKRYSEGVRLLREISRRKAKS